MTTALLTIPSRYYTDPDYYQIEKDKILYRTWQFACHANDIPAPGSFFTTNIGDESVVVVRGRDNEIRAFYNVCRHRAHRILEGGGNCRRLVCPYHAWTYDLDGTLFHAPGTGQIEGFDPASIRLQSVRLENFCGLIFVNLDEDAPGIDSLYPGLRDDILGSKPGLASMVRVHEGHVRHDCNWKVSVENYSECYHCPVVHKYSTANVYSGTDYRVSVENGYVRHYSPGLRDRDVHGDLYAWILWPNFAIQLYPLYRSVSFRVFRSLGPRETDYAYFLYVDPDLAEEQREEVAEMGRGVYHSNIGIDDQAIVRNVQLGLESRSYERGHLITPSQPSATSEHGVAFFQERYLEAIGETRAP